MKHWRLNFMMGVLLALTLLCVAMPAVASDQAPGDTILVSSLEDTAAAPLATMATQTPATDQLVVTSVVGVGLANALAQTPGLPFVAYLEDVGDSTDLASAAPFVANSEGRLLLRQGGIRS